MAESDPGYRVGTLKFRAKDSSVSVACDRLAASDAGTIYLASLSGSENRVKAAGAMLNGGGVFGVLPDDFISLNRTGDDGEDQFLDIDPKRFHWSRAESRYRRSLHRLQYDTVHAIYAAKDPNFLPSIDEESVWRRLSRPDVTTPLLRAWMPWLVDELRAAGLLEPLYGFRCRCGLLTIDVPVLDELIGDGLRSGAIRLDDVSKTETRVYNPGSNGVPAGRKRR